MSKHTAGPWKVNDIYIENRDGTLEVAEILTSDESFNDDGDLIGEDLANANLISAAPELLEALIDCREALRRARAAGELKVVDAAIAKARGEA